jgi:hypothetical protein
MGNLELINESQEFKVGDPECFKARGNEKLSIETVLVIIFIWIYIRDKCRNIITSYSTPLQVVQAWISHSFRALYSLAQASQCDHALLQSCFGKCFHK